MASVGSVAVLGGGAMGSALIRGWLKAGLLEPSAIAVYDIMPGRAAGLSAALGVRAADTPADAIAGADVLLVAVKPADVAKALASAQIAEGAVIVSIAAGVTLAKLETVAPGRAVVRVMPNTPALVGQGASAFARGSHATAEHAATVQAPLDAVGLAFEVKESLLNAVTGLSGSGPAYVYIMIEALADGGVRAGLPRDVALKLAAQTVVGSGQMVISTGEHPGVLKDRVCSPAGTTIAAVAELEANGFRSALIEAVTAATARAEELG